ncbi:MAG: ankyrin repeat domain-containing protein [Desulfobacterales bacterium]
MKIWNKISSWFKTENKKYVDKFISAAYEGEFMVVKGALSEGYVKSINAKGENGWTALIAAATEGHLIVVNFLIVEGAEVNIADDNGDTALMCAAMKGHVDVIKLLLEKGAAINIKDNQGWTALIAAASQGHAYIAKNYWPRVQALTKKIMMVRLL